MIAGRFANRKRHIAGTMNKTEAAYAQHLDLLKSAHEIYAWYFESLKLKLGNRCWYTPDFLVIPRDIEEVYELHEVKGWWEDDARVKVKACADKFPWFRFRGVKLEKGIWKYEEFEQTPPEPLTEAQRAALPKVYYS